ncbi:MAG: prepilin-type N-terminal cleavage/methylation domain-containing protein [Alphaproteobacteria bacterium]|nr:prepilin-type N-terminal cleavage/methylation domain-containing protein [Alphaproteobacteria bacterium]
MRLDGDRGFTLLETLVALAVLGLLLVLLVDGVHLGLQAWTAQARELRAYGDLDAIDRALRRLVEDMDPGSTTAAPDVLGSKSDLRFTATLPQRAGSGPSGPTDIVLAVDARHRLLLRWTPHRHERRFGPSPRPREVALLADVDRLRLAYWPRAAPWGWRDHWSGPVLPGRVRIRIVFSQQEARHWPDIVVAPRRAPRPG